VIQNCSALQTLLIAE